MDQQSTPPQHPNASINLHQQKLVALIGGGVGLLGMILPWATVSGFGGFGGGSQNGFTGWGILSLIGVVGVVIACLLGDKSHPFDANFKLVAMGSFGAIALGAFIYFMQLTGNNGGGFISVKTGIGVWICIIAGVLGILWVAGIIKMPPKTPTTPPTPPSNPI